MDKDDRENDHYYRNLDFNVAGRYPIEQVKLHNRLATEELGEYRPQHPVETGKILAKSMSRMTIFLEQLLKDMSGEMRDVLNAKRGNP